MKLRYYILIFMTLVGISCLGRTIADDDTLRHHVSARVLNAETGETLPFASVYIKQGVGTMTNEEGDFSLMASDDDVLQISYMGYEKLTVKVRDLHEAVRIRPLSHTLQEVTVIPARGIIKKVVKKITKDFNKNRKQESLYFYRLLISTQHKELAEAFVKCKSVANIRDLTFLSGRHGRLQNGILARSLFQEMNLHRPLELAPTTFGSSYWKTLHTPLSAVIGLDYIYGKYDYNMVTMTDFDGCKIYAITFEYKEKAKRPTLSGTLYVDANTYDMLSFKGRVDGITIMMFRDFVRMESDVELTMEMNFRQTKGFTEVETVNYSIRCGDMTTKAMLFNIDRMAQADDDAPTMTKNELKQEKKQLRKTTGKSVGEDMFESLDSTGFDNIMKANADFVMRTTEESDVALGKTLKGDELLSTSYEVKGNDSKAWTLNLPDTRIGNMVNRIAKLSTIVPQEKVYVHMDNTSYFLGDTIWFAAYLRRTSDDKPSHVSGILYVELYNQDGYLMHRQMIEMKDGRGCGNFVANTDWYGGYYELRAYTRWQLNWGVTERKHSEYSRHWFINKEMEHRYFRDYDKLYSRVFPVYDAPKEPGKYASIMTTRTLQRRFKNDPDKRELQVRLYPEGGDAIVGVPCRIAFEAAYTDGEFVDGKIGIKTGKKDIHYLATTTSRGRGVFTYTPSDTNDTEFVFTASADRGTATARLKNTQWNGAALSVVRNDSLWIIRITRSGINATDSIGLTIMHDARVRLMEETTDSIFTVTLHNDDLEAGVNQATVFDTEGNILAERLFFVTRNNLVATNLTVTGVKEYYQPYEPIEITVKKDDTLRNDNDNVDDALRYDNVDDTLRYDNSYVSVSVRDTEYSDALHDNATMQAEMLLSSEVKGFIPNPEHFFEKDDDEHRSALDLLMMTQGWRRFNWRHMAVRGTWDLSQPDERTPIIIGNLYTYPPNNFYNKEEWEIMQSGDFSTGTADGTDMADSGITVPSKPETIPDDSKQQHDFNQAVDDTHHLRDWKSKIPKSVIVHSTLVPIGTTESATVETSPKNGRFRIALPKFYGRSVFHIAASDSAKWDKKRGKKSGYMWIQGMPNEQIQQKKGLRIDYAEFSLRIDFPYPRFVKPYTFYQQRKVLSEGSNIGEKRLSDGSYLLAEVNVGARHSSLRVRNDSLPAYIVDGYEAYNHALDAGMVRADPNFILRSYVSDYGMDYPYITDGNGLRDYRLRNRRGATAVERMFDNKSTNADSLFMRRNLDSHSYYNAASDMIRLEQIERYVFYTDYQPRMHGSNRYYGSNLPVSVNVAYPYIDDSIRQFYRDRRYIFDGISIPDEFYNPDYSQMALPEEPTDHRRTLYWNPALKLNSNGTTSIRLWNNSSGSQISVQAEGMTASGEILLGR